jgi:hypothetical protein
LWQDLADAAAPSSCHGLELELHPGFFVGHRPLLWAALAASVACGETSKGTNDSDVFAATDRRDDR